MKKILLLFLITSFVLSCNKKFTDEERNLFASKEIPEEKAKEMKKRFKEQTTPPLIPKRYKFNWDIYNKLIKYSSKVYLVPVIYSKEDEIEYRRAWGIADSDPAGSVAGYSSFILQYGTNSDYYSITQICPPPRDCGPADQ